MNESVIQKVTHRVIIGHATETGTRHVEVYGSVGELKEIVSLHNDDTLDLKLTTDLTAIQAAGQHIGVKPTAGPQNARPRDWFWWLLGTLLLCVLIALAFLTPENVVSLAGAKNG